MQAESASVALREWPLAPAPTQSLPRRQSRRPVSSTTVDGVDGANNSRQTTSPTIATAPTASNGATFLLDVAWLESAASAARSSVMLISQVGLSVASATSNTACCAIVSRYFWRPLQIELQ